MANFYITTPIYYVNDVPHIGHAYTSVAADAIARFYRQQGTNVRFLTGTDEHGQKIANSAVAAGISPQELVDKVAQSFINLGEVLNLSNDDFIRTTEQRHKEKATWLWQQLYQKDEIYLAKYSGWYAVRDETFYQEEELIDGKAPTGAAVEWVEEDSYFFRMSKWQNALLEHYAAHPDFIIPASRYNEVVSFVKQGLQDISVSRISCRWGITVPQNPQHTMYVWIDALTNYLSAAESFWPADLHLVGKDILRFHAVIWPALLLAAELPLPKQVLAHGWWMADGQKMSKSLGNVISPISLCEQYGVDYVRYFLLREMPLGNDGNFSHEQFVNRINSELVNNVGNLLQRVVTLAHKNFAGLIPRVEELSADAQELYRRTQDAPEKAKHFMHNYQIHLAIEEAISLGRAANEYIDTMAPWHLVKTDASKTRVVLYRLLEAIATIADILAPVIPESSKKILEVLNKDASGYTLLPANIIFPRL